MKKIEKPSLDDRIVALVAEFAIWITPEFLDGLKKMTGGFCFKSTGETGENSIFEGVWWAAGSQTDIKSGTHRVFRIWPEYAKKNPTDLRNLVLLPVEIADLAELGCVRKNFQSNAYELYKWCPEGTEKPERPAECDIQRSEHDKIKSRIPKWLKNPKQQNSIIFFSFMELYEKSTDETVSYNDLRNEVQKRDNKIEFKSNFDQMSHANKTNHAHVFVKDGNMVVLNGDYKDDIIRLWKKREKR